MLKSIEGDTVDKIFALQPNQISDPIVFSSDSYVFKALDHQLRPLDPNQVAQLTDPDFGAFAIWYSDKKNEAETNKVITRAGQDNIPTDTSQPTLACSLTSMQPYIDEMQRRFGVDPADGLQIISTASALSVPFDPGIAVLLLPGRPAAESAAAPAARSRCPRPRRGDAAARHVPGRSPVAGLDGAPDSSIGAVSAEELDRLRAFPAGAVGEANAPARTACPGSWRGCVRPTAARGTASRPTCRCASSCSRRRTRSTTRSRAGSTPDLAEELGDLLLQIVLHAQYAAEDGVFDLTDVYRQVDDQDRAPPSARLRRRRGANRRPKCIRNWEQIKAAERCGANGAGAIGGRDADMPAAFAGLSRSLPALAYAQEMQERAASLGYDWPDIEGVLDKVAEEAARAVARTDDAERREEFGDLLLVHRQPGAQAGHRRRGGAAGRKRKFAAPLRARRAAGGRARRGAAGSADELDELWRTPSAEAAAKAAEQRDEHRWRPCTGRMGDGPASCGRFASAGRPEMGRGLVHHRDRRHARAVRRDHRGAHPAAPARQGHRLGDGRVHMLPRATAERTPARSGRRAARAAGRWRSSGWSAGRCAAWSTRQRSASGR